MPRQRIAIIGGGGAGLAAAWRLHEKHDITLYEAAPRLGGHIHTEVVPTSQGEVAVDLGVDLIHERPSANFCEVLKRLGVKTFVSPLSFSASFGEDDFWENDFRVTSGLWRRLREECDRFHQGMSELLNVPLEKLAERSLGDYIQEHGYSEEFVDKALLPLFSTFAGTRSSLLEYSLSYCMVSFTEGMLSFFQPPYYRKLVGGVASYIRPLVEGFKDRLRLGTPVASITRHPDRVLVRDARGHEDCFEQVVLATHADLALAMLADASAGERELLGHFEYNHAESLLHDDPRVLSPWLPQRASFEYNHTGRRDAEGGLVGSITRNVAVINHLEPREDACFVTLNPEDNIAPERVRVRARWKHAKLRPRDMRVKFRMRTIQGVNRTWFCGMDTSLTGHEGSFVSGMVVSEALGVEYPFADKPWVARQYAIIKNIMGL